MILGLFRIAIASLLIFRQIRIRPAIPLIWGYHTLQKEPKVPYILIGLQIFFLAWVAIGFFTDVFALLFLASNIYFINKSRYYSIEDIYIQNVAFHMPFIGLGASYSVDSWSGCDPLIQNVYMLNSFFLSNALIMLSAGYEKIKSPLWREGKGTSSFMNLPHLVKENFHFLSSRFPGIMIVLGYLVMGAEFILLFSSVHSIALFLILFVLIGFSCCLFILVDISFIGQILLLNLLVIFLLVWPGYPLGFLNLTVPKLIWDPFLIVALMVNFITTTVLLYYSFSVRLKLAGIQKYLTGINSPIGVFNEKHQTGFYTYRLLVEGLSTMEAFNSNGFPGEYQTLFPRYFQAAMYPVTDFCLGLNKFGGDSIVKKDQIIDLLYAGLLVKGKKEGAVVLSVKKFDINDTIHSYKETEWTNIGYCTYKDGAAEWTFQQAPPKLIKTYRVI
jgi:hypothetical protein